MLRTYIKVIPLVLKHKTPFQTLIARNQKLLGAHLNNSLRHLTTRNENIKKSESGIQVYYGTLTPQIRGVKLFSLLTSLTGLFAQPVLYKQIVGIDNLPVIIVAYSFVGFFTLVTPFLLHFITKKYVTSLIYKPDTDTFVATTFNIFNMEKKIEFKPEDVKIPDVLGMFTSFLVKGVPLFVDPRLFEDPTYYGKLMGYDKPLDLKLYQTSLNEKQK